MNSKKNFSVVGKHEAAPSHEEIARAAYRLYELNGRQAGRDLQYWLEAEKSLRSAHLSQSIAALDFAGVKNQPVGNEPPVTKLRKNSANRDEIRQLTSAMRNAPRQSQRHHEQAA